MTIFFYYIQSIFQCLYYKHSHRKNGKTMRALRLEIIYDDKKMPLECPRILKIIILKKVRKTAPRLEPQTSRTATSALDCSTVAVPHTLAFLS